MPAAPTGDPEPEPQPVAVYVPTPIDHIELLAAFDGIDPIQVRTAWAGWEAGEARHDLGGGEPCG